MTTKVSVVNEHSTSFMGGIWDIRPKQNVKITKNMVLYTNKIITKKVNMCFDPISWIAYDIMLSYHINCCLRK